MSRDEIRSNITDAVVYSAAACFIGYAFFYIGIMEDISIVIGKIGAVLTIIFAALGFIKEYTTKWITVTSPYCGLPFQVEPTDGPVKHIKCNSVVAIKNGKAYKMGEVPIEH